MVDQRRAAEVERNSGGEANAGNRFDQTPNGLVKRNLARLFSGPVFPLRDNNRYQTTKLSVTTPASSLVTRYTLPVVGWRQCSQMMVSMNS